MAARLPATFPLFGFSVALFKNLTRIFSGKTEPAANLAAFGKHPGWNDHLDDLGLDTDLLQHGFFGFGLRKRVLVAMNLDQRLAMM